MKSVPYSPFNRTYAYLCYQNQVAHNKNKKSVKGMTDSNLYVNSKQSLASSRAKTTKSQSIMSSTISSQYTGLQQVHLKQQPRIIHKNYFYNQKIQRQIEAENKRQRRKLSETSCRVQSNKRKLQEYELNKMYKDIARKFDKSNSQKQMVKFIDPMLSSTHAFDDPNGSSSGFFKLTSAKKRKY